MRAILLVVVPLLLVGCAHSQAELDAADDARCQGFGAAPGTPAYVDCRSKFAVERMADQSRRRAAILASP